MLFVSAVLFASADVILLQLVSHSDVSIYRIHRLLDGVEVLLEDAVQTPAQVGLHAPSLGDVPIYA